MDNRELDVAIAEKVMGQKQTGECALGDYDCPGKYEPQVSRWPCLPPYSTDIWAAWQVAEMLEHRFGCDVNIEIRRKSMDNVWTGERWERKRYYVTISGGELGYDNFNCSFTIYDDSPSLAVCLAALKCVGAEVAP